jgi:phenylpropionate dioxygenase-like ring-hydroxylating dioxygenase large terminal subunit
VPLAKTFAPGALDGVGIRRFQTAWCGDFLFVGSRRARASRLSWRAPSRPWPPSRPRIDGRRDFNAFEFRADWRVAVENALEGYHVNPIHPQTLAPLGLKDDATSLRRAEHHLSGPDHR